MNNPKKYFNIEIEDKLQGWFSGAHRVVIAGIGNPLRKDDFVGIKIVRDLKNKVPSSVHLIECETVPESFLESITEFNPSHILIIDAALLNLEPGTSKLVAPKELQERQVVSTHAIPLQIFCQYLTQTIEAKIALLVIQPEDTSFGEGLTQKLENTAKRVAKLLSRILGK
jgi:hydrogenase 3 maturation protease